MRLTTTLKLIRQHNACEDRYEHLVAALGPKWEDKKPIPLLRILKVNGFTDTLWALRAVPEKQAAHRDRIARLFATDCAVRVLHLFETKHPTDMRPREAIMVARRFANGKATQEELIAACAAAVGAIWAAARAAAKDTAGAATYYATEVAAGVAAGATAKSTARDTAGVAAYAASEAAAESTERKWQTTRLAAYLRSATPPHPVPLPRRTKTK